MHRVWVTICSGLKRRKMRKYFPDYYHPRTKDEVDALFKTALFSFDTSVILELFVLSEAARETWMQILKAIDAERLWITYQAAREYHVNVDSIIKEQCESTVSRIHERYDAAKPADLKSWIDKNEFFLGQESKEVLAAFATVFRDNKAELSKATNELKKKYLSQCKSTKERLAQLFDERVTPPWSITKLVEESKLAEVRRAQAIPPGYMDFAKQTNIDGDYFVWRQLIDLAIEKKRPIIFVTKDLKEDWFTPAIKDGDARAPRSELRQEMLAEAKQDFMLFSFHDFFEEAKKRYGITATKAVSEEVKKAEHQNISGTIISVLPSISQSAQASTLDEIVERIYMGDRNKVLGLSRNEILQDMHRKVLRGLVALRGIDQAPVDPENEQTSENESSD